MIEEPTLHGFIARLQAKSDTNSEGLSSIERKYIEAVTIIEKRKENEKP